MMTKHLHGNRFGCFHPNRFFLNPEDEINFSKADAGSRTVMSGKLNNVEQLSSIVWKINVEQLSSIVLLWYAGTGTSLGNLSYTWDANKNKTSETIGGTMSGYGFTSAGTSYNDEYSLTGYAACSMCVPHMIKSPTHELLTADGKSLETDPKGISTVLSSSLTPQASQLTPVARTGTGGSVVYVQHDQQTIADYPVGGVASTPTNRYVYASYIDEPVVRKAAGTSGTIHYYHRNQQYSITAMTTSTGAVAERYAYTAYGQPTILSASGTVLTSSSVGNRYTYTGREWDETLGLHHFRARWMSPLAGRFLGRDPIGYWDGVQLYDVYYGIDGTDPSGEKGVRPPTRPPLRPPQQPRPVVVPRRPPSPLPNQPQIPGQLPTWHPGRPPLNPFPQPPVVMPNFPFDPPIQVDPDPPFPNGPEIGPSDHCPVPKKPRTKLRPRTKPCRDCVLQLPGLLSKCSGLNGIEWRQCMDAYDQGVIACRKACNSEPEYDEELYEECIKDAWDFYSVCLAVPMPEPVCKMILDDDLERCGNIKTRPATKETR